ncbi:MAG: N-acetyltransferase [Spirochaetia bacterium]|nr:N-acetyltransferase [Spirochaetia bacterium]
MNEYKRKENSFFLEGELTQNLAQIDFHREGMHTIVIDHTFVSDSLRGQGVGSHLVRMVVDEARNEQAKIISRCPYATKVLLLNPTYQDVFFDEGS